MDEHRQSDVAWRFGCQARPWIQTVGMPAFHAGLLGVMRQIAAIGFVGFETALPVLPLEDPATFASWREQANGLQLAAAHTGGAWWEPETAATVPALLDQVAHLPELGCNVVMVSIGPGIADLNDGGLERAVTTLRSLGEGAARHGVTAAIHNHAHELRNDARVLRALIEGSDPGQLSLGADIGWVVAGGWDPVEFLETFGGRLAYLHIRDVVMEDGWAGFIEVGRGSMDWPALSAALRDLDYAGWLTAESEFSEAWRGTTEPAETAGVQFDGMRAAFSDAG